jgi:hypothetical protein
MNAATGNKTRFLPSTLAAVVVGTFVMPLFLLGWRFIEATFHSLALVLLWCVLAFFVPIALATTDLRYGAGRHRGLRRFFLPLTSPEDFRRLYIPAWKRMFVWFISTVISTLLLKAVGIEL